MEGHIRENDFGVSPSTPTGVRSREELRTKTPPTQKKACKPSSVRDTSGKDREPYTI